MIVRKWIKDVLGALEIDSSNLERWELDKLCMNILDSYCKLFDGVNNSRYGIFAFNRNDVFALNARVKFINFYREIKRLEFESVTSENYEEFKKTDDYDFVIRMVQRALTKYELASMEYKDYIGNFSYVKDYIDVEEERRRKIKNIKLNELYISILPLLPENVRDILKSKEIDEARKLVLGADFKCFISSFSKDCEYDYDSFRNREKYIGNLTDLLLVGLGYDELFDLGMEYGLIPDDEVIGQIDKMCSDKKMEYENEVLNSGPICADFYRKYGWTGINFDNPDNINFIFDRWERSNSKNYGGSVFKVNYVSGESAINMIYTIPCFSLGTLDFLFLHECCHVIDYYDYCGFDIDVDSVNVCNYKPYERLNEVITDMFAMEVREVLHDRGVYFAEPKELINENVSDINTSNILKDVVRPLLDNYRSLVIRAGMTGDFNILFDRIGYENFEVLNHIVNRLQWMIDAGLCNVLSKNLINDDLFIMYQEILDEARDVYSKMDSYGCKVYKKQ